MKIVWFKRDLRIFDHAPLFQACQYGPVLPLYIFEPELWNQPDMSYRHFAFLTECLVELRKSLEKLGQPLVIKVGHSLDIFEQLIAEHSIEALYSHQETWNGWTYERDKRVKAALKKHSIPWIEFQHNGVIRCLKDRDTWAYKWHKYMSSNILPPPTQLQHLAIPSDPLPNAESLGLIADCPLRQKGGRKEGVATLKSFFDTRGEHYTKAMSSPVTAYNACSRLSSYFAFGSLSIREVFKYTQRRKHRLNPDDQLWKRSLSSFGSRLRWHCHFIQKLESEPRLEFHALHSHYTPLETRDYNHAFFEAWKTGTTGFPMVDACMRALIATGWLNFRMRSMLMSFATQHLQLPWRLPSLYLATLFTDYDPGIHYSQSQMQAGITGMNTIRVYNPIKQGIDQDPKGVFIKEWVPELRDTPVDVIHHPWEAPMLVNYPPPIIDEARARKEATQKIYEIRRTPGHRETSHILIQKHGSRRSKPNKSTKKRGEDNQLTLPL